MNKDQLKHWLDIFFRVMDGFLGKEKIDSILSTTSTTEAIKSLTRLLTPDQVAELTGQLSTGMVKCLASNELLEIVEAGDGMGVVSMQSLLDLAAKDEMVYFVALAMRHGLGVALSEIEHNLFPPASADNDLFKYYMAELPPGSPHAIPVTVFGVPKVHEPKVREILLSNGLKVQADGPALTMLGDEKGPAIFGLYGKNVFPLENVSGHMCYTSAKAASEEDTKRTAAELEYRKLQTAISENEQKERKESSEEGSKES